MTTEPTPATPSTPRDARSRAPSPLARAAALPIRTVLRTGRGPHRGWAADEPVWLADDRRRRAAAADAATETNQLYTPYIDLRAADLANARAYAEPARAPDAVLRGRPCRMGRPR